MVNSRVRFGNIRNGGRNKKTKNQLTGLEPRPIGSNPERLTARPRGKVSSGFVPIRMGVGWVRTSVTAGLRFGCIFLAHRYLLGYSGLRY